MRVACNIAEDIAGLSYMLIGMPECGIYSRGMTSMPEGAGGEQRRIYVLDANEVVFGCRQGIVDALKIMDGEGARAILMIATCVTDLIGEDFDGIISETQLLLNARLSYVTLGQFCTFGSAMGTWKTAEALCALMDPPRAEPVQTLAALDSPDKPSGPIHAISDPAHTASYPSYIISDTTYVTPNQTGTTSGQTHITSDSYGYFQDTTYIISSPTNTMFNQAHTSPGTTHAAPGQTQTASDPIRATPAPAHTSPGASVRPVRRVANALFIEPWRNKNDTVKFPLIVGALRDEGVEIRALAAGATLDDYISAPDASLNLVLSSYTQPLAARMLKKFGVPYSPLHNAFAVADIDREYGGIADMFGIYWGDRFKPWRDMAAALEKRAEKELRGLRYAMLPGVDMPVALSLYLSGFGMEPLIINIEDFHQEDAGYARQMKAMGFDPPVCRIMNIDFDIGIIGRLKPDICFGYLPDPPAPVEGLACAEEMGDYFGVTGYERTAGILARVFTVLETGKTGERMDLYGPAPV